MHTLEILPQNAATTNRNFILLKTVEGRASFIKIGKDGFLSRWKSTQSTTLQHNVEWY